VRLQAHRAKSCTHTPSWKSSGALGTWGSPRALRNGTNAWGSSCHSNSNGHNSFCSRLSARGETLLERYREGSRAIKPQPYFGFSCPLFFIANKRQNGKAKTPGWAVLWPAHRVEGHPFVTPAQAGVHVTGWSGFPLSRPVACLRASLS